MVLNFCLMFFLASNLYRYFLSVHSGNSWGDSTSSVALTNCRDKTAKERTKTQYRASHECMSSSSSTQVGSMDVSSSPLGAIKCELSAARGSGQQWVKKRRSANQSSSPLNSQLILGFSAP